MKILATQFVCCFFLSYALAGIPSAYSNFIEFEIAQDTTKEKDRSFQVVIGRSDHDDQEDDFRNNHSFRVGMVDLGISSYLYEGSLDLPEYLGHFDQRLLRSINLGIHLVNLKFGLHKREKPQKFSISTGVKWNIVHYSMEQDYRLNPGVPNYYEAVDYDVPPLKKNRLKANYLQVPLMLEFSSNPRRKSNSFNLAIGYVHQLLLNSNYKYKTEDGEKVKIKDGYNLTKSMGMIEGRVGYGPLNFYVQYGLKSMFQKGVGLSPKVPGANDELIPINIGVAIIPR